MILKYLLPVALIAISVATQISGEETRGKNINTPTHVFDKQPEKMVRDDERYCTQDGPMCKTCKDLVYCVPTTNGFFEQPLSTCSEKQTCMRSISTCVSGPNPDCPADGDQGKYDCRMDGVFPDIYNCSRYYMCITKPALELPEPPVVPKTKNQEENDMILSMINEGLPAHNPVNRKQGTVIEAYPFECSNGFYFNSRHGLCNIKSANYNCTMIGNPCKNLGDAGVIKNNPSMYYICLRDIIGKVDIVSPKLFLCPNVMEFDISLKRCVDKSPDSGLNSNGTCNKTGNFFVPDRCDYYNRCSVVGQTPSRESCSSQQRFDPYQGRCVSFSCQDIGN